MTSHRKLSRRHVLGGGGAVVAAAARSSRCARPSPAAAAAQKVKLQWIEWITVEIGEPQTAALLDAFYKTEAGKNIEIVRQPVPYGQALDKILAMHLAGQAPDLFLLAPPWVP